MPPETTKKSAAETVPAQLIFEYTAERKASDKAKQSGKERKPVQRHQSLFIQLDLLDASKSKLLINDSGALKWVPIKDVSILQ